jgi:hypothetical protein
MFILWRRRIKRLAGGQEIKRKTEFLLISCPPV